MVSQIAARPLENLIGSVRAEPTKTHDVVLVPHSTAFAMSACAWFGARSPSRKSSEVAGDHGPLRRTLIIRIKGLQVDVKMGMGRLQSREYELRATATSYSGERRRPPIAGAISAAEVPHLR